VPGKWSIRQIVAHLADAELVMAHRFRQVIAEDAPILVWFDQDAWAARLDYARRKPKQSLETLRRTRAENVELLKGLAESAYERAGNHTRNGRMTLHDLLEHSAVHTENHARQIGEIREAYKTVKGKK